VGGAFHRQERQSNGLDCQSRDAALKSARGLREHFCAVHYISGPNGARIELKDILEWCAQQARNVG
jgi:hypothetical protein